MVSEKIQKLHITYNDYEKEFNHNVEIPAKTLIIIMIPMFALLISILYIRQKRYFVEHLVFSLHFYSLVLILLSVIMFLFSLVIEGIALLIAIFAKITEQKTAFKFQIIENDQEYSLIIFIILLFYLFRALKRVYGESRFMDLFKGFILIFGFAVIVNIYRLILFFTTYYGLTLSLHQ